ncbi:hypothetical protein ACQ856_28755 (plasmid) [Mycolicibacterium psychrotolerans]|uniref:hypothetical protein n=1 Tax=Mycolicibacterium psychrotolerans TaxID=216929 RepID=UPI003D6720EA
MEVSRLMKWFRFRSPLSGDIPVDTRRVNLTELGHSSETLTSRIDWPDTYRSLDPTFATGHLDEDAVIGHVLAMVDAVAPYADEFTADALNGWLNAHLPGWSTRTDYETNRRLDVQRTLIAEITQNYAVVTARISHQRALVAELEAVIRAADQVLAGHADTLFDPAGAERSAEPPSVSPLPLPDLSSFGHPNLIAPPGGPAVADPTAPQGISIVPTKGVPDVHHVSDTEGEVA